MHAYIDNLNVAYVAFTRAEEELHIFAPALKNRTKRESVGSISALLDVILFSDGGDGGDLHYEEGSDWRPAPKQSTEVSAPIVLSGEYRSIDPGTRLHLRLQGKGVFGEGHDRAYGTLMHRILSGVDTLDRLDETVAGFVQTGELSEAEAADTLDRLRLWLADERVKPWFLPDTKVWAEREILQADGSFYRPDRVVETPDGVVVIDYKFGSVERPAYKKQVRTYMELVGEMGYARVSGFIWYLALGKIVPVE